MTKTDSRNLIVFIIGFFIGCLNLLVGVISDSIPRCLMGMTLVFVALKLKEWDNR